MEPWGSGFKFKETSFNEIKNLEEGILNKIKINHEFGTEKLLMIMDECGHNKEVNINKAVGDRYYISFNINYQEIEKLIDWCL